MARRIALTFCLVAGCFWCMTLAARVDSAPPGATPKAFKPAASVHSLMQGQGRFFEGITQLLEDPTARDRADRLMVEAELLAELANVNRHNQSEVDYIEWAGQLRDTALELAREAKKKKDADEARMRKLHKKLKATCLACHDHYQ